jgi:hypothetical protein
VRIHPTCLVNHCTPKLGMPTEHGEEHLVQVMTL